MTDHASTPRGYSELLTSLVDRIRTAQLRACDAVNRELVGLYWFVGREILARPERDGWGANVVGRLARDLRRAFPNAHGFSERNLKYMRALAAAWPDEAIVQQLLHKLPWGHLVRLIDKVKDPSARTWYLHSAVEHGWSRSAAERCAPRGWMAGLRPALIVGRPLDFRTQSAVCVRTASGHRPDWTLPALRRGGASPSGQAEPGAPISGSPDKLTA